jgi:Carboxypeptidase regulatory-like domain
MLVRMTLVLVAAVCLLAPGSARAQSQAIDGTIEGIALGDSEHPIAGVHVRAVNTQTGYEREVATDVAGRYALPLLPPGAYVVIVSREGFATVTKENLDLRAGQVLTIEVQMAGASFAENVNVSGQTPTIEVGRTVVSNTIEERTVRALPLAGRSIQDFYILQPGVNAGPPDAGSGSSTPTISTVYGGLGLRQMNIDGVSNNLQGGARNLVISEESIAEFQTVTNFSAEFGRVAGGLQNAVTRSGNNQIHGSAYLFTRQKFMTSMPFLQPPGTVKPDLSRYNTGFTLGGPLVKNRVFYFANYERWMADAPALSSFKPADAARLGIPPDQVGTYNASFRAHTLTGKVDAQASSNTRISTRYFYYHDRESPNGFGSAATKDVATRFDEQPQSFTTQVVSILGPQAVNEARGLFASRGISNEVSANPDLPNITLSGIGNFNGNANGNKRTRERGVQLIDNLSLVRGAHNWKMGFDILDVSFKERTPNINGTFTFGGLPAVAGVRAALTPTDQYLAANAGDIDPSTGRPYSYSRFTQTIGPEYFAPRTVNQGYFVQDDIRLSNSVKVSLGLRYELFARPEGQPNPALPGSGVFHTDRNNWAPRLSLAWDPRGNGTDVVRAGYGLFYNMLTPQTFNTFLRGNGLDVLNVNVAPSDPGAPAFTTGKVTPPQGVNVVSDVRVMAADFQDVKAHEAFVTYDRALGRDYSASVTYRINRARNLPITFVTNLTPAGTLADGTPRWSSTGRPNPAFGNILLSTSIGYQNYQGIIATLTKRFSHGVSFQTSYHGSHVEGAAFVNDFTGFGIFTSPSNPQNLSVDAGTGDFDMPHRFTLVGVFEPQTKLSGAAGALLNGWMLAPRIVAAKGYPYNAVTGQDNNGDTVFNDRPTGIGYNAYRVPGYYSIDMRFSRKLTLAPSRSLELIVEGFNLANQLIPTSVNRTYGPNAIPNATFGQVLASQASRQFQLAARFTF